MLQSIPCSPECKIVRKILLDHTLSYALTATTDVPTVYLQQFWRTVSKVPDTEDTINFILDTKKFTYTVDMVGYQGVVDKCVYYWGCACTWGMLIPDAFLTEEICATDDFKEYKKVFMNVDGKKRKQIVRESSLPRKSHKITIKKKKQSTTLIPPLGDDRERDEVAEETILSLTLHKTALAAESQENIAKVQEKLEEEEIEKMVEGDEDEESYVSEFANSVLNDDVDDSEIEKEMKDKEIEKETNIDDVEKTDKVIKKKDIDVATGSMEFRQEKMQTPIPSPTRSPRKVSSSDKTVSEELTATVVPEMTFAKTNEMIKQEMTHLVNLAINKDCEVDSINAQEMIAKEFATYGPKMIEELFRKHMQNTTLNLYPTTSSSTAGKSSVDLQHQFLVGRSLRWVIGQVYFSQMIRASLLASVFSLVALCVVYVFCKYAILTGAGDKTYRPSLNTLAYVKWGKPSKANQEEEEKAAGVPATTKTKMGMGPPAPSSQVAIVKSFGKNIPLKVTTTTVDAVNKVEETL
ncbi:hypothetical protein Tco_1157674 [Tanacetum coccineum]